MSSPGNFDFVKDVYTKKVFEETFQIISNIDGAWEFLKTFEPNKNSGFILSEISRAVERCKHGHSGASWGVLPRVGGMIM